MPAGAEVCGTEPVAPLVLAIETAGSACSAAAAAGTTVLAAERCPLRHGHAEALLPMIDRVMRRAGVAAAAIDIVATSVGPGGFTGIRTGLAAAQGIGLAVGARLFGVTGFAAVAAMLAPLFPTGEDGARALLVALDSRRDDLYVQLFSAEGDPMARPQAVLPERLPEYLAPLVGTRPLLVAGDAAEAAATALFGRAELRVAVGSAPDAEGVLAAASRLWRAGIRATGAQPLYLRPPDTSLPRPLRAGRPA